MDRVDSSLVTIFSKFNEFFLISSLRICYQNSVKNNQAFTNFAQIVFSSLFHSQNLFARSIHQIHFKFFKRLDKTVFVKKLFLKQALRMVELILQKVMAVTC